MKCEEMSVRIRSDPLALWTGVGGAADSSASTSTCSEGVTGFLHSSCCSCPGDGGTAAGSLYAHSDYQSADLRGDSRTLHLTGVYKTSTQLQHYHPKRCSETEITEHQQTNSWVNDDWIYK